MEEKIKTLRFEMMITCACVRSCSFCLVRLMEISIGETRQPMDNQAENFSLHLHYIRMMENDQSAFISSSQPVDILQGNIISSNQENDSSTLDEPVFQTIKRMSSSLTKSSLSSSFSGDLLDVFRKFSYVLIPRQSSTILQQWDLWGPLILITTLAILLQSNATKASNGVEFAEVFSLMFLGAIVVTVCDEILRSSFSSLDFRSTRNY